jgi:hypothetical protein
MAQDLLKITPEALQLQLPSFSFGVLKDLYTRLYQHMRNQGKRMTDAELILVQRKISKLQGELNRRSKLGPDFHAWENKLMHKLKRG